MGWFGTAASDVEDPVRSRGVRTRGRARQDRGRAGAAGADEWLGDLAVLRIAGSPGGLPAAPRLTAMAPGQRVRAWHGSGEAATYARLTVHGPVGARAYLDGAPTGMAVGPGYSGGPLWCGTATTEAFLNLADLAMRDD